MQNLKLIIKISRPRFWAYLFGPFIVGYAVQASSLSEFLNPVFVTLALFFTLPANLLLYGINDYFDSDTDKYSDKKTGKEIRYISSYKNVLVISIYISILLSGVLMFLLNISLSKTFLIIFVLLSIAYSAPPLRFKKRAIIDFLSNILYLMPAFVGIFINGYTEVNKYLVVASMLWVFSMHLFSAIPDIDADKKANINTSAVVFGKKLSLLLCLVFWSISYLLLISSDVSMVLKVSGLVYPAIPILLILRKSLDINKVYWLFPYINVIFGMAIFFEAIKQII